MRIYVVSIGQWDRIEVNHECSTIRLAHDGARYRRHRLRPAGFEPATKGFKGPRVSARLGLSHPPQRGSRHVIPLTLANEMK